MEKYVMVKLRFARCCEHTCLKQQGAVVYGISAMVQYETNAGIRKTHCAT